MPERAELHGSVKSTDPERKRNSMILRRTTELLLAALVVAGCAGSPTRPAPASAEVRAPTENPYASVALTADLSELSDNQKEMLRLLLRAADLMDEVFWKEAYGDRDELLESVADENTRRFAEINYGPWDRLQDNASFLSGYGEKPKGARFYPDDMTAEEFEQHLAAHPENAEAFRSLYTVIERGPSGLVAVPYRERFAEQIEQAAALLREASVLAEDEGFRRYLALRADALLSDEYQESDLAWMDMKDNPIDCVIGPVETYEDQLFGAKAAHTAYVLIKDMDWSRKLARYAEFLPELQEALPVPGKYKAESPGSDADLNAYDVIYYAGDCNAGSKTIAINLPNDEEVQLQKGTRRLQLKNAMRAKFDRIMLPIGEVLIAADQRTHITFDAFFGNTMFHEVAHGLGIKNTITLKGTVREALKDQASALEEGKADILGLVMVKQLHEKGAIEGTSLMDHYVTFLAGIFRSVRFGAASAHGRANMLRFNYFEREGAFSYDPNLGVYRVEVDAMTRAMEGLAREILILQGNGDYAGVTHLMEEMGTVGPRLQADLDRLATAGIPVDIVFEQGAKVLGL